MQGGEEALRAGGAWPLGDIFFRFLSCVLRAARGRERLELAEEKGEAGGEYLRASAATGRSSDFLDRKLYPFREIMRAF